MRTRITRRMSAWLVLSLLLTLVLPVSPAMAAPSNEAASVASPAFSDMPNDWSTAALEKAVANGLLKGSSGKIKPKSHLTRAEMAAIIVRAFGATVQSDLSGYSDVNGGEWFAADLAKARQMGVIQGSDGKMNPQAAITREEAFAIVARALKLQPATALNASFADADDISDWAKGSVYAFVNGGYVQGWNGKLNPRSPITRAEFAQIFDNVIKQYIGAAGTYSTVAAGNVMVNKPNVTLENIKVSGDLIIGDGVGDGEVTLNNVGISGRLVVRGGGEHSIIIKGSSSVANVIVARIDGVVSIKVRENADVELIHVDDGSDDINVEGIIGNIEVQSPDVTVNAIGADIQGIRVIGENSRVIIGQNSKVQTIDIQPSAVNAKVEVEGNVAQIVTTASNTEIAGNGAVSKVNVKSGGTNAKIVTANTEIVADAGVIGVTGGGGASVEAGTTAKNNTAGSDLVRTSTPTPTPPSGNTDGGPVVPPAAPTGLQVVTPSFIVAADGKITGLNTAKVYQYKLATDSVWTNVPAASIEITGLAAGSYEVRIAPNGIVPASAATAVTVAASRLVEAVMLDGKDGVSSQDGKVETIRLKFAANIEGSTVNDQSFTVPEFDVVSIKATDKNGRTPDNELYTAGEQQYITIRVAPKDGTAFTPTVVQKPNTVIRDSTNAEITGIHVQVKDQAAPVIIASEFIDQGSNGVNAGDRIEIQFSENVVLPYGSTLAALANDFTLIDGSVTTPFSVNDQFEISGSTVTVTLGATTSITLGTKITISAAGEDVTLVDLVGNKAKPQKEYRNDNQYSIPKVIDVRNVPAGIDRLIEAVMLDGKDGVSSQDGKVETIRLKFAANIDAATVTNDSFTVPGFDVESVEVTDKNGRKSPNPLYTAGEQQYITIRVTPTEGTYFTPTVIQDPDSVIQEANSSQKIAGIHVETRDQAAPVIIAAEFIYGEDNKNRIEIQFSETVELPTGSALADLANDFTLIDGSVSSFDSLRGDTFEVSGNKVTVTLGTTTTIATGTKITISSAGADVTLADLHGNKAKPQKVYMNDNNYSIPKVIDITNIPAT